MTQKFKSTLLLKLWHHRCLAIITYVKLYCLLPRSATIRGEEVWPVVIPSYHCTIIPSLHHKQSGVRSVPIDIHLGCYVTLIMKRIFPFQISPFSKKKHFTFVQNWLQNGREKLLTNLDLRTWKRFLAKLFQPTCFLPEHPGMKFLKIWMLILSSWAKTNVLNILMSDAKF